jgi:hypothetical protein
MVWPVGAFASDGKGPIEALYVRGAQNVISGLKAWLEAARFGCGGLTVVVAVSAACLPHGSSRKVQPITHKVYFVLRYLERHSSWRNNKYVVSPNAIARAARKKTTCTRALVASQWFHGKP